jgi:hypothetical protein
MTQAKCGFDNIPGGADASELLRQFGPTLLVDIGFDPNFKPAPDASPIPGITGLSALVDTGASESCIDNMLATNLRLPIIDRRPISGAHGSHPTNIYLAQVRVPSLSFLIFGAFAGVDLIAGGQVHYALLGRLFLSAFTMTYEGRSGTVVISND